MAAAGTAAAAASTTYCTKHRAGGMLVAASSAGYTKASTKAEKPVAGLLPGLLARVCPAVMPSLG